MRRRVADVLRSESGNVMVSNIIGAITMLIVAGGIATGIVGLLAFQGSVNDRTAMTKEISLADSVFRSDIQWASTITVTDDKSFELIVPGRDGKCKVSTWTITTTGGKTVLSSTVVSYPGFDASVNPVRCSGTGAAPGTQTLIADAAPGSAFGFTNTGGRGIIYTGGVPVLGGEPSAPAGIPAKGWTSTAVSAITLETSVAASTPKPAAYRITQVADNLSVVQEAADAPSHFVHEGNLTAIPSG